MGGSLGDEVISFNNFFELDFVLPVGIDEITRLDYDLSIVSRLFKLICLTMCVTL